MADSVMQPYGTSAEALAPCHRCGAQGKRIVCLEARQVLPDGWEVLCYRCGQLGPWSTVSMDDAGAQWNRAQGVHHG